MTTKDEALQMALAALETCTPGDYSTGHVMYPWYDEWGVEKAIIACREALAQKDEQEPVAWCHLNYNDDGSSIPDSLQHCPDSYCTTPLYTAPPKCQPLTDEQILDELLGYHGYIHGYMPADCDWLDFARAIEAAHGITQEKQG